MKNFDEDRTQEALPFDILIERLHDAFRRGCHVPSRHVHFIETEAATGTVLIMPAWTDRYLGIKTANIFPGNARQGLPGLFSAYTLYDATNGQVLAQMDGNVITSRRTVASSVLAAKFLAPRDARRLTILGTGRVGSLLAPAYRAAFPLENVVIWDRKPASAHRLAKVLNDQGIRAQACDDRRQAVQDADIVSTATLATEPIVLGSWLKPGSHLDLIGSFTPMMREADDDAFRHARLYIDTSEALQKSGDLLGPLERGIITPQSVVGTLADLCTHQVQGRQSSEERTVFKSVGTALEDLAAAVQVYEHWHSLERATASKQKAPSR